MDNITKDVISILQYLLPGFLAAWVFYGLTSFQKPSQFERIIQALIFTLFIQLVVFAEKLLFYYIGKTFSLGSWSVQSELLCSVITAILLGGLFSAFSNNDLFHKLARRIKITKETSYPSEWFGAFLKKITFVVLHFKDERRLYGWPTEWPSEPDKGHFVLEEASWLDGDKEIPITGVDSILINVEDIKWVEFMTKTWEAANGKESRKSATTQSTTIK